MKILVAYYSRTGNTKKAAKRLAASLDADIAEIKDFDNRDGSFAFVKAAFEVIFGIGAKIADINKDIKNYDLVLLCTPIWLGRMSSPARAFLKEFGKDIQSIGYVLLRGNSEEDYRNVYDSMDDLINIRHVAGLSLFTLDSDFYSKIDDFAYEIKNLI